MGHDEAVVPVFPNSDYCTGIAGCTAILQALIRRAEEGGSYGVDASLPFPLPKEILLTSRSPPWITTPNG